MRHKWVLNISEGFGCYSIDPVNATKGDMLVLDLTNEGKVATNNSHVLSDYFVYQNQSRILLSKLSFKEELRFSIKPILTNEKIYKFYFEKKFESIGIHLISATYNNSKLNKSIEILKSNQLKIFWVKFF